MVNNNNFAKDLLKIYSRSPCTIETIFKYNLINTSINTRDSEGNSLLHYIIRNNDEKTLIEVLNYLQFNKDKRSLINAQNNDGDTAMHVAVRNNNVKFAKLLDNAGADTTIKNQLGEFIHSSEEKPVNSPRKSIREVLSYSSIDLSDLDDTNSKPLVTKNSPLVLNKLCVKTRPEMSDSEQFVERLKEELNSVRTKYNKYNKMNLMGGSNDSTFEVKFDSEQDGGAKKKKKSKSMNSSRSSSAEPKESSKIHDQVIKKFTEMNYSMDDARALKAGLYSMVKEQFSDLNNLDRAKKMLEYLKDKKTINILIDKMDELKQIIENAKKLKNKQDKEITVKTKVVKKKASKKSTKEV
jgi:ankyrin repeat protein